jgi:hypothetical protein
MANTGLSPNTILMAPTLAIRAAQQENMNQELSPPLIPKQNRLDEQYNPKQVRKCKQSSGNKLSVFAYFRLIMLKNTRKGTLQSLCITCVFISFYNFCWKYHFAQIFSKLHLRCAQLSTATATTAIWFELPTGLCSQILPPPQYQI